LQAKIGAGYIIVRSAKYDKIIDDERDIEQNNISQSMNNTDIF